LPGSPRLRVWVKKEVAQVTAHVCHGVRENHGRCGGSRHISAGLAGFVGDARRHRRRVRSHVTALLSSACSWGGGSVTRARTRQVASTFQATPCRRPPRKKTATKSFLAFSDSEGARATHAHSAAVRGHCHRHSPLASMERHAPS
jgi:hypothetical protein